MRPVLLVAQPTTGGVARCVAQLAGAGVEAGYDVHVACPAGGELATEVIDAGATWHHLPLRRSAGPADLLRILQVRSLAKHASVVHLHSSKAGAVGRLALIGKRPRPACVFTPHAHSWLAGGSMAPVYARFERMAAGGADAIVAVSGEERELAIPVLGAGITRVRVIENGVDTVDFCPEGPKRATSTAPLITCVGRLSDQKGQDVGVRALALLQHPTARLRLVGDGPNEGALTSLAKSLGVDHRLELAGHITDIATEFRSADVVVAPSRWEGLSLALLEAMACGAVVVASRVAGSAALEGAGVLVGPDDPPALARAIDGLLADPDRRGKLGAAARRRAEQHFDVRRSLARTLDLWAEMAR